MDFYLGNLIQDRIPIQQPLKKGMCIFVDLHIEAVTFSPFMQHHCLPAWLYSPEYRNSWLSDIWDKFVTLNSGFFTTELFSCCWSGIEYLLARLAAVLWDPALKSRKALAEEVLLGLVLSVSVHFFFVLSFKSMRVVVISWEFFVAITFFSPLTICWCLEWQQCPEQQKRGKNNVGEEQSKERLIVLNADNVGGSPGDSKTACGVQVWDTSLVFFLIWGRVSNQYCF